MKQKDMKKASEGSRDKRKNGKMITDCIEEKERNMKQLTAEKLAGYFDHTQLKAYVTDKEFDLLCKQARDYGFAMVAVNPAQTERCKKYLEGTKVHVGAAIGFPLGQMTIEAKVFETEDAILKGADEIDYVVNLVELKNRNLAYVEDEMRRIVDVCKKHGKISKVIFENCYLTDEEKKILCEIALQVKPDFIKTSTGFGTGGATKKDVALMKNMVGDQIKVKAAGGVRDLDTALMMIDLGVSRIGTSASVEIMKEFAKRNEK